MPTSLRSFIKAFHFIGAISGIVCSTCFSQSLIVSNRFITHKIDSTLLAQSSPQIKNILASNNILRLDANLLGERSYYPWESLKNNINRFKSIGYHKAEEKKDFSIISLNVSERNQLLGLLSPFIIDFHPRTRCCYADPILSSWDSLEAFPLVDSLTYRIHYGENPLPIDQMRVLLDNFDRECSNLEKQRNLLRTNEILQVNDIRKLEENSKMVDLLAKKLFSHMIHDLMYEEAIGNNKDSINANQQQIIKSYQSCLVFRNDDIILYPALFPILFNGELNRSVGFIVPDSLSNGFFLDSVTVTSILNSNSILIRTINSQNFTLHHKLPVFSQCKIGEQNPFINYFTAFSVIGESAHFEIKSGLIPPSYFLPQIQRVKVVSVPVYNWDLLQDFVGWDLSQEEKKIYHKPWAPSNAAFMAKVVSISGFWDIEHLKLYMENKPLNPSNPKLIPEIYYRVTDPQKVIIKPSLDLNPRLLGLNVSKGNIIRQLNIQDNTKIQQVSLEFPRGDPVFVNDISIRSKSRRPVIVHGVQIIFDNGYLVDLSASELPNNNIYQESPNIPLRNLFYPGWIKKLNLWVSSSQNPTEKNPKPLIIELTLEYFENHENPNISLRYLTRIKVREFLDQRKELPLDQNSGLPFVTIHTLIPD